ncbi:putative MFS-type transporter C09D4.1 [Blattella germanica]|nr:putative MFS-type transporter C09D4.1 [Blattella germanica]
MKESTLYEEVSQESKDVNSSQEKIVVNGLVNEEIEKQAIENGTANEEIEYKVYKRRWAMLGIFLLFAVVNCIQWIQYAIINNLVMKYYNVSSFAVDWTSIIFMAGFIPLIFPAMYILEKKGLKWTIFLGMLGTTIGAWIKAFSVSPNRFWGALVGQAFVGSSQAFLLGVPPNLAAVWFGSNEVSTACSLGVFGLLLGTAVGFPIPPFFVKNHDNVEDIGSDLSQMFYCTAGFCTVVLILVAGFFQAEPPLPPSPEQALKKINTEEASFFGGIKNLLMNRGFLLLIFTYAINGGEEFAGQVGLVFIFGGMLGTVIFGIILDKTHKYKETALVTYALGALGMLMLTFSFGLRKQIIVFVTAFIFGLFNAGYMPVGFELGSEITYPEPEGTTGGLVILTVQLMSVFHAMGYSELVRGIGDKWANIILTGTLVIGTIFTAMIPNDLRRQAAHKVKTSKHLPLPSVDMNP